MHLIARRNLIQPIRIEPIIAQRREFNFEQILRNAVFQIPNPAQNENPPNVQDPVQTFINESQNTHNSSVTMSVSASLKRLKARYLLQEDGVSVDGKISIKDSLESVKREILDFLSGCRLNPIEKEKILEWFNTTLIQHTDTIHGASGLNLSEILVLVWLGICDKNCINKDAPFSDADIEDRKITLLKNIFESQQNGVCFVGNMNNIVASLDLCHPDVFIDSLGSLAEIKNSALRSTTDHLVLYVKNSLLKLSPHEINEIYTHWENDENQSKSAFMNELKKEEAKELKKYLNDKLIENYGHRLDESSRNEIIQEILDGSLDYLARPEVDILSIRNSDPIRNDQITRTFSNFLSNIKTTDFKSWFATKRAELELNKKVPDHVYAIYKHCEKAISDISKIENPTDNIFLRGVILSSAVDAIRTELQNSKNGVNWNKFNRSSETATFYESLNTELSTF